MKTKYLACSALAFLLWVGGASGAIAQESDAAGQSVRAYETEITMPTYEVEKPDPNPVFYTGKAYQGAQKRIYPYALDNNLTDSLAQKNHKALFLENEHIKLGVLPERGGKLFMARDKSSGYDFVYHNQVIKPALIGMLGAWTSGGIEWNIPHHHRATAESPIDYAFEEHSDGSKTIWIGETERRHRSRWIVGITLRPGASTFEADLRYYNTTSLQHSILMWANTAVHANENYQVVFPPSTDVATFHAKNEFTEWPVSRQMYQGVDYTEGVDISWWKSHPDGTSFFAWDAEEEFVAGYDHGRDAGLAVVANRHVVPGKKLWNWGTGEHAQMWYDLLTEEDGPYLEIMTGAYSDNQPDYSWSDPFVRKRAQMYFYPLRETGAIEKANKQAAVSLDSVGAERVRIAVNTTTSHDDAEVRLMEGERVLHQETVRVGPSRPFSAEISTSSPTRMEDLKVEVRTAEAQPLISYQPPNEEPPKELPEPVDPPPPPEEVKTVEQLYLIGLRLDQFHSPTLRPELYFEEALRRDPGHSQVNTHLGLLALKSMELKKAEKRLRTATARVTDRYTRPHNSQPLYYLGVALMRQGRYDEAYSQLYDASWDKAWYGAAHTLMAEISARRHEYSQALDHANQALDTGEHNVEAGFIKAVALRKINRRAEAEEVVDRVLEEDPLFWPARYEKAVLNSEAGEVALYPHEESRMREEAQNYLDVALAYGKAGAYETARSVLNHAAQSEDPTLSTYPMIHYFRGYYASRSGDDGEAVQAYQNAAQMPTDYAFPYRYEAVRALNDAISAHSSDARAHLYLGNLYYDTQPKRAIEAWEKARTLDPQLALVHRNLAFGYAYTRQSYQRAVESMERALKHAPEDSRYYYEADRYAEWAGQAPTERLERLLENHDVVKRDDGALAREVALLTLTGAYDHAISILSSHHFRRAEGAEGIHDLWVDTHLLRGQEALTKGDPQAALEDFKEALKYPENLEVATSDREGKVHYFIGQALDASGKEKRANEHYERAANPEERLSTPLRYYQALALDELGREKESDQILNEMIAEGRERLNDEDSNNFFAKFGGNQFEAGQRAQAHYVMGLGYAGLDKRDEAQAAFEQALQLDPSHRGAATQIDQSRDSKR